MDLLTAIVCDLMIIGIIASFCDLLLPDTTVRKPVQMVFALYFMALLLNPLVLLWTDSDPLTMDFSALGENVITDISKDIDRQAVYDEAGKRIEEEIKGKLAAIYQDCDFAVTVKMREEGFVAVTVKAVSQGNVNGTVMTAEIRELLAADYGIEGKVLKVSFKRSGSADEK